MSLWDRATVWVLRKRHVVISREIANLDRLVERYGWVHGNPTVLEWRRKRRDARRRLREVRDKLWALGVEP